MSAINIYAELHKLVFLLFNLIRFKYAFILSFFVVHVFVFKYPF